jgi:hypothetical protein
MWCYKYLLLNQMQPNKIALHFCGRDFPFPPNNNSLSPLNSQPFVATAGLNYPPFPLPYGFATLHNILIVITTDDKIFLHHVRAKLKF